MQQLVLLPTALQKEENLDEEINLVHPLNYPYNLFLNLEELLNPDLNYVYFFAYILGREKIVFWGVYDKAKKDFYFEGSCRYTPGQLYTMTKVWKAQGQTYVANTVKNRIDERLSFYLDRSQLTYDEYKKLKYLLSYIDGKITFAQLESRYPGSFQEFRDSVPLLSPDYDMELYDKAEEIREKVDNYQKKINRLDISRSLQGNISGIVSKITERFKDKVELENGFIASTYSSLANCPSWEECQQKKENCQVYFYGSLYPSERDLA